MNSVLEIFRYEVVFSAESQLANRIKQDKKIPFGKDIKLSLL